MHPRFFPLYSDWKIGHDNIPPQKFAKEAKNYLEKLLKGRKVTIKLHRLDQYERCVASVHVRKYIFWKTNISLDLLRNGYAELYRGRDAQYGGLRSEFEQAEGKARYYYNIIDHTWWIYVPLGNKSWTFGRFPQALTWALQTISERTNKHIEWRPQILIVTGWNSCALCQGFNCCRWTFEMRKDLGLDFGRNLIKSVSWPFLTSKGYF